MPSTKPQHKERVKEILSWYKYTNTSEQQKNLSKILNYGRIGGTGKVMILPIDQILEHGPGRAFEPNPIMYDPLEQAQFAVDGGFNAYAAPLGSLERGYEILARHNVPTILKVNSHTLMIPDNENPKPSIHSWVDDAVRLGCSAVGFTLYPGSIHSNEMEQQARMLIADARKAGLITILWIYPRGAGLIKGQERAVDIIAYGVALGVSLGAQIIKVKLPIDSYGLSSNQEMRIYDNVPTETLTDRIKLVMKAAYNGHRIVIHSGGDYATAETLESEIRAIREGGAFGSIMGRNAFQRPTEEALNLIKNLQDILVE
jgi:class I fructose-bisphosphate aldolase